MRSALIVLVLVLGGAQAAEKPKSTKGAKIEIDVVPGALRFATTRFDATAGESLSVTLTNTCIMPHNWVLTKPGEADAVMILAMAMNTEAADSHYVPKSSDKVLAYSKIVNPGQSETVKLNVPSAPGEYPFLCTFPGHGTIMRGVLRVKPAGEPLEPPVVEKLDLRKPIDALKLSGVNPTPLGTREHPYVLRSFVPNPGLGHRVLAHHGHGYPAPGYDVAAGKDIEGKTVDTIPGLPAGIAVNFGPDFSYVWDATECRLMYAWMGGFLDLTPYWGAGTGAGRRSRDYVPALVGTIVYKAAGGFPISFGEGAETQRAQEAAITKDLTNPKKSDALTANVSVRVFVAPPKPKFLGYRMLSGNPEFMYEVGGVKIHEHIMPTDPGTFMIHYRVDGAKEPVRLSFDPKVRLQISCDGGTWNGDTLEIPVDHADHFMLLVKFQPGQVFKFDPKSGKASTTTEP